MVQNYVTNTILKLLYLTEPNIYAHGPADSVRGRDVVDDARDVGPAGARRGQRGAPPGRRPRPRGERLDLAARTGRYIAAGALTLQQFIQHIFSV